MLNDSLPVLSASSLDKYIQSVRLIPNLSFDEEQQLARDFQETGNLQSAKKLILSHLKLVVFLAAKFRNYGFNQADLIQEGNIGLMKAVKGFDPSRGLRLVSYANQWIAAEITDYIVRNFRQVKIATTKAQRKLFFNLRKLKKTTSWMKDEEVISIADQLDVSPEEVRIMEGRLSIKDCAYHAPTGEDEDTFSPSPENYLGTTSFSGETVLDALEETERTDALMNSIAALDHRSQDVIKSRWLSGEAKSTLHDLADKYGVSGERIRQVERNALKKMRAGLDKTVLG